jgi:hypothetical protein
MREIVDNAFWDIAHQRIERILDYSGFEDPKKSASCLVHDAKKVDHYMYVRIKGVDSPQMTADMSKCLREVMGPRRYDESDFLCLPLHGTTFSGHPTATTLGNTFRSLCYAWYYLEQAGFSEPWTRDDLFVAAAGDDVVIWVDKAVTDKVVQKILELTSRDKKLAAIGLGQ